MATFRVGVGSFNIKDSAVGIGTETTGHGNLKVEGTLKSTNLDVLGVSTFTRYSGFNADEVNVNNRDLTLSGEYSTTGDIVVEDGASLTVGLGSTACVGSVECVSVKHHFSVPVGDIAQRNEISGYGEGTIRYNTDLGTMEFFNGSEWRQFNYQSDIQNSSSTRGRAVISSGSGPETAIEFLNIATKGNTQNFGVTTQARTSQGSCSNEIRGVFGGGYSGGKVNTMDYITIAATGDATDFGDLTTTRNGCGGCSSSTRGLWVGGTAGPAYTNVIEYAELMTLGNAIDFGDLVTANSISFGTVSSPTRGITGGGLHNPSSPVTTDQIDLIIIASKGDSVDSGGDLTRSRRECAGASNNVRGVFGGGDDPVVSTIDYITLASLGNAINFGELSTKRTNAKGVSSQRRALFVGGTPSYPAGVNIIEYVEIATTGNTRDFGDLSVARRSLGGVSDCHGGLGGY